jgi:hypothetical protein
VQPVAEKLFDMLVADARGKVPQDPLLSVPSHTARELDRDLVAAKIPKSTPEGKLDFHALRNSFITIVLEDVGGTPAQAQELARHATLEMTMGIYARARQSQLRNVVDAAGDLVLAPNDHVTSAEQPVKEPGPNDTSAVEPVTSVKRGLWRRRESNPRPDSVKCEPLRV